MPDNIFQKPAEPANLVSLNFSRRNSKSLETFSASDLTSAATARTSLSILRI